MAAISTVRNQKIQVLYLLAAIVIIGLFFCIPRNYLFVSEHLLKPPVSYSEQFKLSSVDQRKEVRYGAPYFFWMQAAKYMDEANSHAVLLLPPAKLMQDNKFEITIPEPAEFYYYTGHIAVWANSPQANEANTTILPKNRELIVTKIQDKVELNKMIRLYLPYLPAQ